MNLRHLQVVTFCTRVQDKGVHSVSLRKIISISVCYLDKIKLPHLTVKKALALETPVVSVFALQIDEQAEENSSVCTPLPHFSTSQRRGEGKPIWSNTTCVFVFFWLCEEGRSQSWQTFKFQWFSICPPVVLLEMPIMHFPSYKN